MRRLAKHRSLPILRRGIRSNWASGSRPRDGRDAHFFQQTFDHHLPAAQIIAIFGHLTVMDFARQVVVLALEQILKQFPFRIGELRLIDHGTPPLSIRRKSLP
jgi:hypothetical protein